MTIRERLIAALAIVVPAAFCGGMIGYGLCMLTIAPYCY